MMRRGFKATALVAAGLTWGETSLADGSLLTVDVSLVPALTADHNLKVDLVPDPSLPTVPRSTLQGLADLAHQEWQRPLDITLSRVGALSFVLRGPELTLNHHAIHDLTCLNGWFDSLDSADRLRLVGTISGDATVEDAAQLAVSFNSSVFAGKGSCEPSDAAPGWSLVKEGLSSSLLISSRDYGLGTARPVPCDEPRFCFAHGVLSAIFEHELIRRSDDLLLAARQWASALRESGLAERPAIWKELTGESPLSEVSPTLARMVARALVEASSVEQLKEAKRVQSLARVAGAMRFADALLGICEGQIFDGKVNLQDCRESSGLHKAVWIRLSGGADADRWYLFGGEE